MEDNIEGSAISGSEIPLDSPAVYGRRAAAYEKVTSASSRIKRYTSTAYDKEFRRINL